jgi:hypothetical protein
VTVTVVSAAPVATVPLGGANEIHGVVAALVHEASSDVSTFQVRSALPVLPTVNDVSVVVPSSAVPSSGVVSTETTGVPPTSGTVTP